MTIMNQPLHPFHPVLQVAAKFGVTRETQDQFAASSHAKAAHAQSQGLFDAEIVPGQ